MKDIKEKLKFLKEKKKELENTKNKIDSNKKAFDEQQKAFEDSQKLLISKSNQTLEEINLEGKHIVSIRLGDLIDELSFLMKIDKENIVVEFSDLYQCYGRCRRDELPLLLAQRREDRVGHRFDSCAVLDNYGKMEEDFYSISLFANANGGKDSEDSTKLFYYRKKNLLDLDEIQTDGKTLLEHCEVKSYYDRGRCSTWFSIGKDIEDLSFSISLNDLVKDDELEWAPASLMTQAIVNCLERKNREIRQGVSRAKVLE